MRKIIFAAGLATVSFGAVAMGLPPILIPEEALEQLAAPVSPVRRRRNAFAAHRATGGYRSRGPQAHRARKSNRLTVGKRVRRKHRRAA